jgi:hypothetical protein
MKAMKILAIGGMTLLNIKFGFLPNVDLLVVMGIAMVIDFLSGIAKSIVLNEPRTSTGYRKTIIKFIQYGGAILVSMGITYLGSYNREYETIAKGMKYFNNGLLILIIFIEITSILENIYSLNKTSKIAKHVIRPALKIFTIEIKNNPIARIAVEAEDKDDVKITTETITSKNIIQ